jgi:16S rRNA (uracil1498-N3)-methyltransferase
LRGREAHHALHVLRVRTGERIIVLDGTGNEIHCDVAAARKYELTLAVVERKSVPPLPCAITLLQAIPKGKIIESIIQKATELGVARIVPLLSERVVTHLDSDSSETKTAKWQQVAIEAIKQSGNAWLPKVETPVTPAAFLARREKFDLPLVASLHDEPRHLREHVKTFVSTHQHAPKNACIWIGPEGDFTHAEVEAMKAAGALPISLGRLILRVETAATCCLAMMNYELNAD